MVKRNTSSDKFRRFMLLYALFFIMILIVGLRFWWTFLENYEASRPHVAVKAYVEAFDENHIRDISSDFIAGLDHRLESEEESFDVIKNIFNGDMTYSKISTESTANKMTYSINVDGKRVGKVMIESDGIKKSLLEFSPWSVCGEEYDFSSLLKSDSITIADDWSVAFNDYKLDSSFVSQDGIEYVQLADYYGKNYSVPYMVTYEVGNFVSEHDFQVYDRTGAPVELPESEEEKQALFLSNCPDTDAEELKTFMDEFVKRYVRFSSNADKNFWYNCTQLQQLIVPDSTLYSRLPQAQEGMTYSASASDTIQSINTDWIIKLSSSGWLVSTTYTVRTVTNSGPVVTSNHITVVVEKVAGSGLLVSSMTVDTATVVE